MPGFSSRDRTKSLPCETWDGLERSSVLECLGENDGDRDAFHKGFAAEWT